MIKELSLAGPEDLVPVIEAVIKQFGGHSPMWRGHGKEDWELVARSARVRYDKCPPTDDPVGWLFLMQHFGLETRLLDLDGWIANSATLRCLGPAV